MREEGDRNLRALWDDGVPELVQPLLLVGVGHPLMHRDLVGLVPDLAGHALQRLRVNFRATNFNLSRISSDIAARRNQRPILCGLPTSLAVRTPHRTCVNPST